MEKVDDVYYWQDIRDFLINEMGITEQQWNKRYFWNVWLEFVNDDVINDHASVVFTDMVVDNFEKKLEQPYATDAKKLIPAVEKLFLHLGKEEFMIYYNW